MERDLAKKKQTLLTLLHHLGLVEQPDLPEQPTELSQNAESDPSVIGSDPPTSFLLTPEEPLYKLGEIPAVQDRFHALLKRRLLMEAQQNPPLFPWEDAVTDYETESTLEEVTQPSLAAASVWMTQIRQLNLPISMPESVLMDLLARCQAVLFSSLREGAKLVRAVDSLFPGQAQLLNDIAGYVMVSPARSSNSLQDLVANAKTEFPESYDAAIDTQQMALSLLAAREILSSLTLTVSPQQPPFEREWLTELGAFQLRVSDTASTLRIEAELPCGGSLQFQGQEFRSTVDRDDAGRLNLEIRDFTPGGVYPLEVRLGEQDVLTFAVYLQN
jgi:hypothetical protein